MKLHPYTGPGMQAEATPSSPNAFRGITAPRPQVFQGTTTYSWYDAAPDQPARPYPLQPVRQVKFGVIPHPYCGVCPICVAGAAARAEVAKIGDLRKGEDIEITVEEASQKIREMGKKTGAKVGRTSIGNEDGTRLQPFSEGDLSAAAIAALPRIYTVDKRTYVINGNPRQDAKGTDNGTYKLATSGQQLAPGGSTFDYSCQPDAPPPPIEKDPAKPMIPPFKASARKQPVRTYGIYHHIAEGDEARYTKRSQPLLLGYATFTRLQKDELLVVSLRELPRFERLGAEAGGLMNVLGTAAKTTDIQTVAVAVEPWQTGLLEYIGDLRDKYNFPVREIPAQEMPAAYMDLQKQADMPGDTRIFRIPLAQLKATWATIDPELAPGEQDTELLKSIEMPDAIRDGENDLAPVVGRNLANCPPISAMTFLTRKEDPDLELETEPPVVPAVPVDDYQID